MSTATSPTSPLLFFVALRHWMVYSLVTFFTSMVKEGIVQQFLTIRIILAAVIPPPPDGPLLPFLPFLPFLVDLLTRRPLDLFIHVLLSFVVVLSVIVVCILIVIQHTAGAVIAFTPFWWLGCVPWSYQILLRHTVPRSLCLLSLTLTAATFACLLTSLLPGTGILSEPVYKEYGGGGDFKKEPTGCVVESVRKYSEDAPYVEWTVGGCCRRQLEEGEEGGEWDLAVAGEMVPGGDFFEDHSGGYYDGYYDDDYAAAAAGSRFLYTGHGTNDDCRSCLELRDGCADFYEYSFTSLSTGQVYTDVHEGGRRKADDGETVQELCGENGGTTEPLYGEGEWPEKVDCWRLRVS